MSDRQIDLITAAVEHWTLILTLTLTLLPQRFQHHDERYVFFGAFCIQGGRTTERRSRNRVQLFSTLSPLDAADYCLCNSF